MYEFIKEVGDETMTDIEPTDEVINDSSDHESTDHECANQNQSFTVETLENVSEISVVDDVSTTDIPLDIHNSTCTDYDDLGGNTSQKLFLKILEKLETLEASFNDVKDRLQHIENNMEYLSNSVEAIDKTMLKKKQKFAGKQQSNATEIIETSLPDVRETSLPEVMEASLPEVIETSSTNDVFTAIRNAIAYDSEDFFDFDIPTVGEIALSTSCEAMSLPNTNVVTVHKHTTTPLPITNTITSLPTTEHTITPLPITTTSTSLPTSSQQITLPGSATKTKTKQKPNKCIGFIKSELSRLFSEAELANGRLTAGKRKYKDTIQEKNALSPGRMKVIIGHARKKYKEDFENIQNISEVINSKCRQVNNKTKKSLQL